METDSLHFRMSYPRARPGYMGHGRTQSYTPQERREDTNYPFNQVAGAFGLYMVAQSNLEASLIENSDSSHHRKVLAAAEKLVNDIFENYDELPPGARQLVQVLANQVQWSSLGALLCFVCGSAMK